jgi:hypothetical protein
MSLKNAYIVCILFIVFTLSLAAIPNAQSTVTPQPSPVELGDIKGAVVTLYYYNPVTEGKGAMVPLPGNQNPQEVEWDYTKAAPGTYTFYKVPVGIYYIEAVHGNHSYFAIANVSGGTTTANVAIPPNDTSIQWQPVDAASATSTPSPVPSASSYPSASAPVSTSTPGMTTLCALAGLAMVAIYLTLRKE